MTGQSEKIEEAQKSEGRWIPIFPLPLVLFPGMALALHIFEDRYQVMMQDIMVGDKEFGVTLYMESAITNVGITTAVGVLAGVREVVPLNDGKMDIQIDGIHRFKVVDVDNTSKPYLQGRVIPYDDEPEETAEENTTARLAEEVLNSFQEMIRLNFKVQKLDQRLELESLPDPATLSYRVAEYLSYDITLQQLLLEMTSVNARLRQEKEIITKISSRLAVISQINAAFEPAVQEDPEQRPPETP